MIHLLWAIPALPLAGFAALALLGARLPRAIAAAVGVGTVGLSAAAASAASAALAASPEGAFRIELWTWMEAGGFAPQIALRLDPLSAVMSLVATGVGLLILIYSVEFMAGEEGWARYFAWLDLFVGAMLVLVLADDLLLLYLGFEGVGLASFLLIGFRRGDPAAAPAARKAFLVTRIGDTAFAIGLLVLFDGLGTSRIDALMARAAAEWPEGSAAAIAAAALVLGGAVGKSAQVPLHTWLPDAMAGPTPVSALIHAATMVTAGVYLIARLHVLFELAPPVLAAVGAIGAAGVLLGGAAALVQRDLKRILAWSTISQIAYLFLALGVGAWIGAIFHLATHACFKALLFLAAGAVIHALHHEQDVFRMGGLRRRMPFVFWTFLAGAASLAALPAITAGFWSKDRILSAAWAAGPWGRVLWAAGIAGAFLTSLYAFRMVFLVFLGPSSTHSTEEKRWRPGPFMAIPLAVLAVLSLAGGFLEMPPALGGPRILGGFLSRTFPGAEGHLEPATEMVLAAISAAAALGGLALAWGMYGRRRAAAIAPAPALVDLIRSGWGFDRLYQALLVRPFLALAGALRADPLDRAWSAVPSSAFAVHRLLCLTQNGRVRWYAMGMALGAAAILAAVLLWRSP